MWNLTTRHGDLDISFVPNGTTGYDDLARNAHTIDVSGVAVPVADLADIARSKEAAGRPKDLRHLPAIYATLERRLDG